MRIEPTLPPENRTSYHILAPAGTHWRPATCEEVVCRQWRDGWVSRVNTVTAEGIANYIRHHSGRQFTEEKDVQPGVVLFRFGPGQMCFAAAEHRVRIERPEIYVVRGGDYRGNPRQEGKRFDRPDQWVDEFAEHQQALADRLEQG